jgi:ABC-type nitrate/sulfonate/bicarbonate transport system substrate-binding protein
MRRCLLAMLLVLVLEPGVAEARDKVKVGVLKLSSSAVLFLGVEKGFFKEFGVEPELVFFQAAVPIATALAAGPYQDRNGRLWVADIETQMTWWQKHGFTKRVIPLEQIVDTSFVEAAVRAVRE